MDEIEEQEFKKDRGPNWSDTEMEVLADACKASVRIINGKLKGSQLTAEMKKVEWLKITEKVNAVSTKKRSGDQTKKKWTDVKTLVKKKEATRIKESRKTGGGPPPDVNFKPWELKVLSVIPDSAIMGLVGAVDSGDTCTSIPEVDSAPPGPMGDVREPAESEMVSSMINIEEESSTSRAVSSMINIIEEEHEEGSTSRAGVEERRSNMEEETKEKRKGKEKKRQTSITNDPFDSEMQQLIEVKRQRNDIEKRKAAALERIAACMERNEQLRSNLTDSVCVSPVIKFM